MFLVLSRIRHRFVLIFTVSYLFLFFYHWSAFRGRVECSCNWCNPVTFHVLEDQKKITIKEHCKNFNEWWVYSFYAVTSRKPQIYKKKYVQNQNKKTAEHLISKYNKWVALQSKGVLYKKSASFSDSNSSESIDPTTVI
jgi:hypothetical protein